MGHPKPVNDVPEYDDSCVGDSFPFVPDLHDVVITGHDFVEKTVGREIDLPVVSLLNHAPQSEFRDFASGARRSRDADETRYDLITPIGLEEVARAYAEGVPKYGAFNWEKGMPAHDLLNHVLRHIYKFLSGDRSEPHLGHAAWGCLAAIHSVKMWPELNQETLRGPGCTPPKAG